jgi:hypothetical protein
MKKVCFVDPRRKNRERGREREGKGKRTEEKVMEKEGLKKGKGNCDRGFGRGEEEKGR